MCDYRLTYLDIGKVVFLAGIEVRLRKVLVAWSPNTRRTRGTGWSMVSLEEGGRVRVRVRVRERGREGGREGERKKGREGECSVCSALQRRYS